MGDGRRKSEALGRRAPARDPISEMDWRKVEMLLLSLLRQR